LRDLATFMILKIKYHTVKL